MGRRLFGLAAPRGRWLLIPLGIAAMLCLGTVYSWSLFRKPLESELGLSATASLLPFTVALVCFAAMMPLAGRWISRGHSRRVAVLGALVVGLGYLLASGAHTVWGLVFTYGVIAGSGIGLAYGVPLAAVASWFPERKGLAVGLVVAGFGLSPLITAPLAQQLISALGTRATLRLFGLVFLVVLLLSAWLLQPAPASAPGARARSPRKPARAEVTLRSRPFAGLWLSYAIGSLAGLSAVGMAGPVAIELIQLKPALAAASVSLFAVFNGASRPLFGWLCDRWSPARVAMLADGLILVGSLVMLKAGAGDLASYLVAFCMFWSALGGWLAIAPATTLRCFEPERYAEIYGLVFTAYGVGALLGTVITGQLRDWFGSYTAAFGPLAGLAALGILLASLLLRSGRPQPPA
jgi:OFA family oxalate/formate antiporter-like MFS transporter